RRISRSWARSLGRPLHPTPRACSSLCPTRCTAAAWSSFPTRLCPAASVWAAWLAQISFC
ncbi:hypothetical protein EC988_009014, partial [Linderina pennispora]